jgi:hypothetical protein
VSCQRAQGARIYAWPSKIDLLLIDSRRTLARLRAEAAARDSDIAGRHELSQQLLVVTEHAGPSRTPP